MVSIDSIDIDVNVDIRDALLKIEVVKRQISSLDDEVDIDINTDRSTIDTLMEALEGIEDMTDMDIIDKLPDGFLPEEFMKDGGGGDGDSGFSNALDSVTDMLRDSEDNWRFTNLRMSSFHNLLAKLLPLLLTVVAALPAVITALITLAAAAMSAAVALGAIAVLGFIGAASQRGGGGMPSGEDFMEMLVEIRDTLFEAFEPLAKTFAPLINDALQNLDSFLKDVVESIEPFNASLKEMARNFGSFIGEFIPKFIRGMLNLAMSFRETFSLFGSFLEGDLNSIIQNLIRDVKPLIPEIVALAVNISRVIPIIIKLSHGFLIVVNVILMFIGLLSSLTNQFGLLFKILGAVLGSLLVFLTILNLFAPLLNLVGTSALTSAASFLTLDVSLKSAATSAAMAAGIFALLAIELVALGIIILGLLELLNIDFSLSDIFSGMAASPPSLGGGVGGIGGTKVIDNSQTTYNIQNRRDSDARENTKYISYQEKKTRKQSDNGRFSDFTKS